MVSEEKTFKQSDTGSPEPLVIRVVFLFHIPMSYETNKEKNGMGTKSFITIYIPNSFIVNIRAAPVTVYVRFR
jgi:hypothetical protein